MKIFIKKNCTKLLNSATCNVQLLNDYNSFVRFVWRLQQNEKNGALYFIWSGKSNWKIVEEEFISYNIL